MPPTSTASPAQNRPRLGLALGSGAARGWAHMGVFRALKELGVEVDVYAGCSVGALISAAKLLGMLTEFEAWARQLGPLGAVQSFGLSLSRGGLINPDKAFATFAHMDKEIADLPCPWGAVATDLGSGEEVWLTEGSVLKACRASAAVPMALQAAHYIHRGQEYWLIDGAMANPVPTNLARALGAERVIAVDLNCLTKGPLTRFNRPATREIVTVEAEAPTAPGALPAAASFLKAQSRDVARRFALAKAKALSRPQFLETAMATTNIIQAQLAEARAKVDIADLRLTPDLSMGSPAAFDQWQAFEEAGYVTTMAAKADILALTQAV